MKLVYGDLAKGGNDEHYGGAHDATKPSNRALLVVPGNGQEVIRCDDEGDVDNKDCLAVRGLHKLKHVRLAVLIHEAPTTKSGDTSQGWPRPFARDPEDDNTRQCEGNDRGRQEAPAAVGEDAEDERNTQAGSKNENEPPVEDEGGGDGKALGGAWLEAH